METSQRIEFFVFQPDTRAKFEITFDDTEPLEKLFIAISDKLGHQLGTFTLEKQRTGEIFHYAESRHLIKAAGFEPTPARNSLVMFLSKKSSAPPLAIAAPPAPPLPKEPGEFIRNRTDNLCSAQSESSYTFNRQNGFVGLVNQAMTCYLNSLLQALFMTPEFRNALYKWKFEKKGKEKNECIPYQLQKLFLNLQTSKRPAVETTELTRSFGWMAGEVWQQQDIQELCRVMFDALEREFKDTEQADLINTLYQGKMIDYVKCLECKKEKHREDTFLDIPLPVRPFSSTIAYESINEALKAFVKPETLDGNNQYFCESCNKKCDAHKGLKFTKFPYLLTLHLKRFDFDYKTLNRIKLNDRVSFPEKLNLNKFVINDEEHLEISESKCDSPMADSPYEEDLEKTDISELDQVQNPQVEDKKDIDEGIDLSNGMTDEKVEEPNGPYIYELYSIMIHSGSASGGHYYAYIKDFAKNEWFCFNDQSVTSITREDIEKTYGGGTNRAYYSSSYSSSTNAYMLMYRQIENDKNSQALTEENFPPHIIETLEDIKKAEEEEKENRARREEMVEINVYSIDPVLKEKVHKKIYVCGVDDLSTITRLVYDSLKLKDEVAEEDCRLVFYNKEAEWIESSLEGDEDKPFNQILKSKSPDCDFFLETKEKDKPFVRYTLEDVRMIVYVLDPEKNDILSTHHVRTTINQDMNDLHKFFQTSLSLESSDFNVFLPLNNEIFVLNEENLCKFKTSFRANKDSHGYRSNRKVVAQKIFICPKLADFDATNFKDSKLYKCILKLRNVISLVFILPTPSCVAEKLRNFMIPSLDEENDEKPSETTPTSELVNGIEEEVALGSTSDQSTSEDSSLTDSERTIVGDQNDDYYRSSGSESEQLSSPDLPLAKTLDYTKQEYEGPIKNHYFSAQPIISNSYLYKKYRVIADIRTPMSSVLSKLEKIVKVSSKYLKVTKGSESEKSISVNYLKDLKDEDEVNVVIHRVLNEGEFTVKTYLFNLKNSSKFDYFCDWVVKSGVTVGETKKALLKEMEKRKLPHESIRLWEKSSQRLNQLLLDDLVLGEGTNETLISEMFIQILEEPDRVTQQNQKLHFARRWHPSPLNLGPTIEIITESDTMEEFKSKLSPLADITVENLQVSFASHYILHENILAMSLRKLNWNYYDHDSTKLPCDDTILFFKDRSEEIEELTKEEEIKAVSYINDQSFERQRDYNNIKRKERSLKIYSSANRTQIDVD